MHSTCCVESPYRKHALGACIYMLGTAIAALCNLRTENPITSPRGLVRMKVKGMVLPGQSLKIKVPLHPALLLSWSMWAHVHGGGQVSSRVRTEAMVSIPCSKVGGRRRNCWYRNQTAFSWHGEVQWDDC